MNAITHWTAHLERESIRDIIAAIEGRDPHAAEWSTHARNRHGTAANYLRAYIKTLDKRWLSFDQHNPMLDSERLAMKEYVRGLLEAMTCGFEVREVGSN